MTLAVHDSNNVFEHTPVCICLSIFRGVGGYDSLKDGLKYLDWKVKSGQTTTETKPGTSVVPQLVDKSSVTVKREELIKKHKYLFNIIQQSEDFTCFVFIL